MGLRHPLLKVYLSRKEFSFVMYIGLFSCILVSFHICWSLFTWRLKKRHSKCNRLYFKCIYRASSSLLSCILVSFHVYWSLFINVGLFSRMLLSFHVYWSLMTCRYTSSLSITKGILFSCTLFFFHISYIGLFSCTLFSFHAYWSLFMHTGLF